MTSQYEDFSRNDTGWSGLLYKCANAKYAHKLARLDLPTSCDMRAPERRDRRLCARMRDGRARGRAQARSARAAPALLFGSRPERRTCPTPARQLRECYRQGAEAFGWDKRNPEPRSMRDGSELVGWGMATGIWEALQVPIAVRIVLTANGHAEVACATSDIGTGTYTIMAQVAADMLGLPLDNITRQARRLDAAAVAGRRRIVDRGLGVERDRDHGRRDPRGAAAAWRRRCRIRRSPALQPDDVVLADGKIVSKQDAARAVSIADAMRHGGVDRIEQEKIHQPSRTTASTRSNTHSAIFAEVKVDEQLGVIRVTRVVSAVAAGRILNPKTAHSQIMGGVVWGIGMALHEETLIDHRFGRIMNANIAEYHVPVNADVHDIKVIFVDEPDDIVNPLGIKGVGEIGIVGVAAAIANAVYHATGKRVRDLPITLDKLMRSVSERGKKKTTKTSDEGGGLPWPWRGARSADAARSRPNCRARPPAYISRSRSGRARRVPCPAPIPGLIHAKQRDAEIAAHGENLPITADPHERAVHGAVARIEDVAILIFQSLPLHVPDDGHAQHRLVLPVVGAPGAKLIRRVPGPRQRLGDGAFVDAAARSTNRNHTAGLPLSFRFSQRPATDGSAARA